MEPSRAKELAWKTGQLRYLLRLQPAMFQAYDSFHADIKRLRGRIWYLNISRQFGKSYASCVLALEQCLRKPRSQVKYCAQDQKNARSIVFPQMEKLLADCPDKLTPEFRATDGVYYFPHNQSRITIAGADKDNIRKLRGQAADLCIVDEGGFMHNLRQVVLNVLLPQTTTTGGRLIIASTPPESSGHYSHDLAMQCKSRDAYFKFTVHENKLLSQYEKDEIILECGGADSSVFQREYMCEFITDTNNAVVPEFDEKAEKEIVHDYPRPEYFDSYTSLDGGFTDAAGCLFGYYDYRQATLVVEDEWTKRAALGSDIAGEVAAVENRLWGDYYKKFLELRADKRPQVPWKRIMDIDPQLTAEFARNHGMVWTPVEKSQNYKQAAVNQLNDFIKSRRLVILTKCKSLIRQLHNAVWDKSRRSYLRDEVDAHYDLVDALVYMHRSIDYSHNPFPPDRPKNLSNWFTTDIINNGLTESEQAISDSFSLKGLADS